MAKPNKGQFQLGNEGKSKMFKTVSDLEAAITSYFDFCDDQDPKIPYTIEGLCDTLECDRLTLLNYQKKEGYEPYFSTIKKAKIKIQRNKVERGLMGLSHASVTIFDLKNNHGYKDKTEVESKTETTHNISELQQKVVDLLNRKNESNNT